MKIGDRIREARESKKLTQEELGRLVSTTKQTIFKYESGIITNIPIDRIELIAKALNVSAAWLMGFVDNPSTHTVASKMPTESHIRTQRILRGLSAAALAAASGLPAATIREAELSSRMLTAEEKEAIWAALNKYKIVLTKELEVARKEPLTWEEEQELQLANECFENDLSMLCVHMNWDGKKDLVRHVWQMMENPLYQDYPLPPPELAQEEP